MLAGLNRQDAKSAEVLRQDEQDGQDEAARRYRRRAGQALAPPLAL